MRNVMRGALVSLLVVAMLSPGMSEAQGVPAAMPLMPSHTPALSSEQQAFLDKLQHDTFRFFWDASPANGLTPDRSPGAKTSSVAAVGFALTSYVVGVERGYVTRAEAAARTLSTLTTLWEAPMGPAAEGVAGHNGLYYHFLDGDGVRSDDSELSTIDTALLMAGVLSSQAYFDRDDATEKAIRALADQLYRRVDWTWAYSPTHKPLLSLGWSPEDGFIDYDWRGYSEGMLLYILALGSPTHPVDAQAWEEWTRTYRWDAFQGAPHVTFGPMFGHQYSHVWIDFRGIQDPYMRSKGIDYFENSARATYANRAYCIANPGKWAGYGELLWGLTASDGPFDGNADTASGKRPFRAYWARGASPGDTRDDGTLAPADAHARAVRGPALRYVRVQGLLQPHAPGEVRAGLVRRPVPGHRSGAHSPDDRELPDRPGVEPAEEEPLRDRRAAEGRVRRRVAGAAAGGAERRALRAHQSASSARTPSRSMSAPAPRFTISPRSITRYRSASVRANS